MPLRLLAALALIAAASGCDTAPIACTLIGCNDALAIVVSGADGTPAPGRYVVSASSNLGDEEPVRCAFTVTASREVESECGAFVNPGEPGVRVLFPPLKGALTIDVERDGALLSRLGAEPAYAGLFPNGPDCGEVCRVATVRVAVD